MQHYDEDEFIYKNGSGKYFIKVFLLDIISLIKMETSWIFWGL